MAKKVIKEKNYNFEIIVTVCNECGEEMDIYSIGKAPLSYALGFGEITPLALQKILYFIQGIYMVLFGEPLYEEVYDFF